MPPTPTPTIPPAILHAIERNMCVWCVPWWEVVLSFALVAVLFAFVALLLWLAAGGLPR